MLNRALSWSFLVALCVVAQETEERVSRLVVTAQGPVRGYKDPAGDLFVFYGVPYATAPTGPHRFKAPLPPPRWEEPLEAIHTNIVCPQVEHSTTNQIMQEDCLIANIHVPDTDDKNLPVAVYVHGGAFQNGRGGSIKLTTFVQNKKVIVVTFNYRVGIHGFLCLGTNDAPGNAGMKDQVALLRWVNTNIEKFGGNPQDVTIIGCSAGSASVDLLMLSKSARGLFNKVISGSGSSISAFSVQIDPVENAKMHAKILNFSNVDDTYALGKFYATVPFEDLLLRNTFRVQKDTSVVFAPCVERYTGVEMFLDEAPINILRNGNYRKVPVIYGFTDMEGLMRLPEFEEWSVEMNDDFTPFLPIDLQFRNEEEKKEVAQTIKEFYFGDKPVNEDTILEYLDFNTDVLFAHSMLWSVNIQVENGNNDIYLYEYSYVDKNVSSVPYAHVVGAGHCAQEFLLLDEKGGIAVDESSMSVKYKDMKSIIADLWYNFIRTSKPVPDNSSLPMWPPVVSNCSPHMSFGQTLELKGPLLEQRARFWDNIYARFYRAPKAPEPTHKTNPMHKPKPIHKPRPK
ncbi:hypothetical protein O3G_MSEX008080 [Manduca sexta]|uniref:Carboxylic ester hydrolase n=1 Tax=Manduca sexta TaxID=7130 RepID=A0A921Z8J1_MANSE|nr:hypothetical protein O3G_MSEX008080 [Manduca sexta]UXP71948.1 esterase [Manduca sexta]